MQARPVFSLHTHTHTHKHTQISEALQQARGCVKLKLDNTVQRLECVKFKWVRVCVEENLLYNLDFDYLHVLTCGEVQLRRWHRCSRCPTASDGLYEGLGAKGLAWPSARSLQAFSDPTTN